MPLLHGIYTSGSRSLMLNHRYRTAGYNLYPADYLNNNIQAHLGNSYEMTKRYLGSFMGRDSHAVRNHIFELKHDGDLYLYNTTREFAAFGKSPQDKSIWRKKYVNILELSKYSICPRGVGAASLRLFESMKMGVAPVVIADDWIFPKGPDWNSFALIVKERDVSQLHQILKSHEGEYEKRGRMAYLAYNTFFSDVQYFNYLVDQMIDIKEKQIIPERLFWICRNITTCYWKNRKKHLQQ